MRGLTRSGQPIRSARPMPARSARRMRSARRALGAGLPGSPDGAPLAATSVGGGA